MRILAIGLGGAGCRIVNSLYSIDHRSSNVACVNAFALDVDDVTLAQLKGLPESAKIYLPALDPGFADAAGETTRTATIDIGEVISRIQNLAYAETDAIFICCGLGGSMVDVAPHIIAAFRNTVAEPIFCLVTLPCLAEGERKSVKAADDIDMLSPLLDGIILFDNETWYKKIRSQKSTLAKRERSFAEKMGFVKEQPAHSPKLATYLLLNDAIVKRIRLILRAGEFKADGGLELAEVVLDSGEILNTMMGMGFITIGYAVEHIPRESRDFLSWLRPARVSADDHNKRASRIVELAKQAIYHEISTPCDMTSAHKALILVAGPSHELSMKGFMTVRKWIDRSIAGLETRSGDYPVVNTRNVAIIVMLSGLENIPRIDEIRGIRVQCRTGYQRSPETETESISLESVTVPKSPGRTTDTGSIFPKQGERQSRDEMVVLSTRDRTDRDTSSRSSSARSYAQESISQETYGGLKKELPDTDYIPPTDIRSPMTGIGEKIRQPHEIRDSTPQRRVVVPDEHDAHRDHSSTVDQPRLHPISHHDAPAPARPQELARETGVHINESQIRAKDTERHRIEKDLQRQRMVAISGRTLKTNTDISKKLVASTGRTVIQHYSPGHEPDIRVQERERPVLPVEKFPEQKTVIIGRKKAAPIMDHPPGTKVPTDKETAVNPETYASKETTEERKVSVKELSYRAKDDIFGGKCVGRSSVPTAREIGLIHTQFTPKNIGTNPAEEERESQDGSNTGQSQTPEKKRKIPTKKDDISWI